MWPVSLFSLARGQTPNRADGGYWYRNAASRSVGFRRSQDATAWNIPAVLFGRVAFTYLFSFDSNHLSPE